MTTISPEVKQLLVVAYKSGKSGTYKETAGLFGVSVSAVSRTLRRERETGSTANNPKGGNNPRKIDLEWLKCHAQEHPDARLQDRVDALIEAGGSRVSLSTMGNAMRKIGWTFKKTSWCPRA